MRPLLVLALILAIGAPARALDFKPLEAIPVQEGGRKKPCLVFAEENLLALSGRTALTLDGRTQSALEILSGLWLAPEAWGSKPILLVNNLPFKSAAGLDEKRKWFSRDELAANPRFLALLQHAEAARRTAMDGKLTGTNQQAAQVGERIARLDQLRGGELLRVVANPAGADAAWFPLPPDDPALAALRGAFVAGDPAAFAKAAAALRTALAGEAPQFQPPAWKIALEVAYQKVHPFRWAWILYLAAGITLAVTSLRGRRAGYLVAWLLAATGALFQIAGFASRIAIAGRPPVSNMYESVIWVAFGAVFFALIFETIFRGRYFLLGATFAAVIPLLLADSQPLALDRSIHPLTPILQSNFWLATHVLIITLSYAAFLLALGVAHIALGKVLLGRPPSAALYNYIYRTIQVGVLLLATGTILGAVWANYSWGRFWDWDPKETWALVALLGYLIVLHGRIAGAWGGFGLALGAVLAFQSVLMAWYGVNFVLGVGLHSYGFGSGGFGYALTFVAIELAFAAAAAIRHRAGRSAIPRTGGDATVLADQSA
ncbi:MAG: cytochrome c biogenesis protein CcsA [Terrimicrobiaceae bacterium]|nr:cytochrome c biogenesis protein CcsA [Terrimicrobiaceae bacterium]